MRAREPKWPKRVISANFAYGDSKKNCIWGSQCAEKSCARMVYNIYMLWPNAHKICCALWENICAFLAINFSACIVNLIVCVVSPLLHTVRPTLAKTNFHRSLSLWHPFLGKPVFLRKFCANGDHCLRIVLNKVFQSTHRKKMSLWKCAHGNQNAKNG